MSKRKSIFEPVSNPVLAAAMRELRRSNASGTPLDRRPRRNRDRSARTRRAINDSTED